MILVERVERRKTVFRRGGGGGSRGREVERGRPCKGHHSNCPGLPFIPFVRPSGALPHPPSPSASPRLPPSRSPPPPHHLPPSRTDGSKSFLRLIFPSNLHAAVIKGLGAQYIIRRFADATVKGVGFTARGADRPSSKQWRLS